MPTAVSFPGGDLQFWASWCVHASSLVGLLLTLAFPRFRGLWLIIAVQWVYVALATYRAGVPAGMALGALGALGFITVLSLGLPWWSKQMGLRFAYVAQDTIMGAVLGAFVLVIVLHQMFWLILGLLVGAVFVESRRRPFLEALRHGAFALHAMLGTRGFEYLMALAMAELALGSLRPL